MSQTEAGFYHLGLSPDMLNVLDRLKFVTPTPIQQQAIPVALEGKDIMGVAQTGTGKTLAYGIPLIQRLASEGGQALILVPTRELAFQVDEALEPLLKQFKMTSAILIGGIDMSMQIPDINNNPSIIIATPGRMNDHIYQGTISMGKIGVVVLDEADRMLDMGFEDQVNSVLMCVPNKEQTMMFSATMPVNILKLAKKYLDLPITIEIARSGTSAKDVSQELFIVKEALKNDVVKVLLEKYRGTVIVFVRTKIKADKIARDIEKMGVKVAAIHADRNMSQRHGAIEGFKRGRYRVLVATDIAARGIDISKIELVINYDLPDDAENYVHRIGRTGRAGKEGHSVTLATPTQSHDIKKIETLIKTVIPRSMHPKFASGEFRKGGGGDKGGAKGRPFRPRRKPKSA